MKIHPVHDTQNYYKLPSGWQSVRGEKQEVEAIPETAQVFESIPTQGAAYYRIQDIGNDNPSGQAYCVSSDGFLAVAGSKSGPHSHRGEWDAVSKEKPEYYAHVPDVLWEAFASSFAEGEEMIFDELLDLPKWEVGFHKSPPQLHYTEVDDADMLSFDYLSYLDVAIEYTPVLLGLNNRDFTQEDVQAAAERGIAKREQLATIRDNLAQVLTPPLTGHADMLTTDMTMLRIESASGDRMLEERFIAETLKYEIRMRKETVETVAREKGVDEELMPQLLSAIDAQSETMETERRDFLNYLLKSGSNLYDHLEVPADT